MKNVNVTLFESIHFVNKTLFDMYHQTMIHVMQM